MATLSLAKARDHAARLDTAFPMERATQADSRDRPRFLACPRHRSVQAFAGRQKLRQSGVKDHLVHVERALLPAAFDLDLVAAPRSARAFLCLSQTRKRRSAEN